MRQQRLPFKLGGKDLSSHCVHSSCCGITVLVLTSLAESVLQRSTLSASNAEISFAGNPRPLNHDLTLAKTAPSPHPYVFCSRRSTPKPTPQHAVFQNKQSTCDVYALTEQNVCIDAGDKALRFWSSLQCSALAPPGFGAECRCAGTLRREHCMRKQCARDWDSPRPQRSFLSAKLCQNNRKRC